MINRPHRLISGIIVSTGWFFSEFNYCTLCALFFSNENLIYWMGLSLKWALIWTETERGKSVRRESSMRRVRSFGRLIISSSSTRSFKASTSPCQWASSFSSIFDAGEAFVLGGVIFGADFDEVILAFFTSGSSCIGEVGLMTRPRLLTLVIQMIKKIDI